jgi:pimeloyl-ACP methyl ester carboxylesterase
MVNRLKKTLGWCSLILIGLVLMIFFAPDLDRHDLEKTYAQAPSQFIEVEGLRFHYRDTGDKGAPAIVMLHGFGSSLHTWDEWSTALEQDHRVIRLDLPGFGLTGESPDHDYSDAADVERLSHFLSALGVTKCLMVGHSMGGRIAWNFASTYPDHVVRLVLMAPDGFPVRGQKLGEKPYDFGRLANVIQYVLPKFLVKKSLEPAFYNASGISDGLLNRYNDLLRAPTVRSAILDRMRQTVNSDPVERLQRITAPTLLLWGKNDLMIPSSNSQDYQKALRHSQTVILPKASHLLQEENPQLGLAHVLEFVNSQVH